MLVTKGIGFVVFWHYGTAAVGRNSSESMQPIAHYSTLPSLSSITLISGSSHHQKAVFAGVCHSSAEWHPPICQHLSDYFHRDIDTLLSLAIYFSIRSVSIMSDLKAYLAAKCVLSHPTSLITDPCERRSSYMSGPKADAILARSSDPVLKKKRKKQNKNEDYIGGSSKAEASSGLMLRDEDEVWGRSKNEEEEGDDAPGMFLHYHLSQITYKNLSNLYPSGWERPCNF